MKQQADAGLTNAKLRSEFLGFRLYRLHTHDVPMGVTGSSHKQDWLHRVSVGVCRHQNDDCGRRSVVTAPKVLGRQSAWLLPRCRRAARS